MIPLSLAAAALATEGRLSGGADPDSLIAGPLVFDSRDITPGSMFCCLAYKSVDGHDFAVQAVAAGAVAVLANRPVDAPAILVPDVLGAMGRIAARVSSEFAGTVIGLTGSAGKTSTKDLLTSILELDGPTVATPRSFNNEIGFPVTVSRVEAGSRYLLLEMGARGLGHIDSLCDIARPTISTVLGVGSAHIGEFGSREVTAQAKAEIVRALPAHGTAVLNGDDPLVSAMAGDTDATVITFGFGEHCDIRAEQVGVQHDGRPHFVLVHGKDRRRIELRVHGRHNVLNALAAAATAIAAGIPADRIAQGLRQGKSPAAAEWKSPPAATGSPSSTTPSTPAPNPCSPLWLRSATSPGRPGGRSRCSAKWPSWATRQPPGTTRWPSRSCVWDRPV